MRTSIAGTAVAFVMAIAAGVAIRLSPAGSAPSGEAVAGVPGQSGATAARTDGATTGRTGRNANMPSTVQILPVDGQTGFRKSIDVSMTVVQPAPSSWRPPIGIPVPPFGIQESHTMYQGQMYAYTTGAGPYRDAGNGPYTHYVDNTSPASTDTNNPYGTTDKPRKTIPTRPAAGSVIEVHGGPYGPAEIVLVVQGTAVQPVFLRGIGKPRIAGKLTVYSSTGVESRYLIVEGLDIYKAWVLAPASYLSYRNCNIQGDATNGGVGIDSYSSAYSNHHLVFYNNKIHDNGDWLADYDQDAHGIVIARYTNNVWIVDNEFYHNSGDGVQINAQNLAQMPYTHHIYLGRNLSHENKQSGMWTKQATDVIFSQNTVYGMRPIGAKPSAYGSGMGFQYGPERVWILYNHIYDCCYGISSGSTSGLGNGLNAYVIGNLIHDIHHDPNYAYTPATAWSNAGISLVGPDNRYVINNTIHNVDGGIYSPSGGKMVMINNIISNITEPLGRHIFLENGPAATASVVSNDLFYQGGDPARIIWASGTVYSLPAFQAAFGKGAGCLMGDPLFANTAGGDYTPRAGSPAVDAAAVSDVYATFEALYGLNIRIDSAGTARPQGAGWDIGALERH